MDYIDCICHVWHGPEQLGLSGALGDPGLAGEHNMRIFYTDVFFDKPWRVSMCIKQGPSLPLKLRALGGRGSIFSCAILGVRWEIVVLALLMCNAISWCIL